MKSRFIYNAQHPHLRMTSASDPKSVRHVQRKQFPGVAGVQHKIHDDLFELNGIDECASGLRVKHYGRLNLFTDRSLQNIPDDILVLMDKFLVQNGLVKFN
jgi:hypothetical protein